MTLRLRPDHPYRLMEYGGPVGDGPAGWTVTRQEPGVVEKARLQLDGRNPGDADYFHVLRHNGRLWMSDTDAEKRDHVGPIVETRRRPGDARVLIHGLGMGLIVAAALRVGAEWVDVVEVDADLIGWQRPWLDEVADTFGGTVAFHHGDALNYQWPRGSRWHVVWHDIWRDITADNLPDMHRLHRRFGRRADWQGSWCREYIEWRLR